MDDERQQTGDAAPGGGEASGNRVDWAAALDVTAGDLKLLLDVLDAFQIEAPQQIVLIHESLASRDVETLHRAAHTAKNAFYNIGAQATGDLAFQLEMIGKIGAFDQVPPLLEQLELHMQQVEAEVKQFQRANGRG